MATYKGINGYAVQTVASDPSPGDPGQVFYNTTSKLFEYTTEVQGSWTSGGNLSTARSNLGGAGTQTAAAAGGGLNPTGRTGSPGTVRTETEEYNGTSWTSGGSLGTAKYGNVGCGTQTAALSLGGASTNPYVNLGPNSISNVTQEYDGTSWTSGGNYPIVITTAGAAGTQTSALAFGGFGPSTTNSTNEYDGTSWTAGGNLGTARYEIMGAGTQTSALAFGGYSNLITTEAYNGTSWSTQGSMTTGRSSTATSGTQTAALAAGGRSPITNATEEFTGGPVNVNKTISFS